jgi:hypothetical protein
MNLDFINALKDIEKEKGISSEVLLQAILIPGTDQVLKHSSWYFD